MRSRNTHYTLAIVAALAILAAGGVLFVYSGLYNIGADVPHTRPVLALVQALRERSIEAHAQGIQVPNLDDPQLVLKGAGQYAAMCTDCHLAPGMTDSEIRPGLYPQPPKLSQRRIDPREAFWVIKHGIKMSAMPAWGTTHDDPTIWSMVAFLQKLPGLSPAEYRAIVAKAPPDEDMEGMHDSPAPAASTASAPVAALTATPAAAASSGHVPAMQAPAPAGSTGSPAPAATSMHETH